jgi:hypothetical protein
VPDHKILAEGTSDPAELVSNGGKKEWFLLTDPTSGKTFAAHATPPSKVPVLDTTTPQANNLYTTMTVPLRNDQGVRMLGRLQKLYNALGAAQRMPDNDPAKVSRVAFVQNELNKYRQNIEVMRALHNRYGYGRFYGDSAF